MFVQTIGSADRALRARRAFFGPLTRLLNPTIRRLAGRAGVPLVGVVSHQGRRSGRTYATPVAVASTGTALLIPLTFGPTADWVRNVLAASGCTVVWHGRRYLAHEAAVVDDVAGRAEVHRAFGPVLRIALQAMGTHHFLRLGHLET